MSTIQHTMLVIVTLLTVPPLAAAQTKPLVDCCRNPLPNQALTRLGTKPFFVENRVFSVAFSRNGKWFAAGDWSGLIYLWETATGKVALQLDAARISPTVFFSSDGTWLGARNSEGEVRLWEISTGKLVSSFRRGIQDDYRRYEQHLFSPDGRRLIAVPDINQRIAVRNGKHADAYVIGDQLEKLSIEVLEAPGGKLVKRLAQSEPGTLFADTALSPDGNILAVSVRHIKKPRQVLRLFNAATGKQLREITGADGRWFLSLAFTLDGKTLALGSHDEIVLAEVATGKVTGRLTAKMSTVAFLGYSADGQTLVSHSHDHKVRSWHLATGLVMREFAAVADGHHVRPLPTGLREPAHNEFFGKTYGSALSPDGKTFAVGVAGCVQLWDVVRGKPLYPEQTPAKHWAQVKYAPDNRFVLVSTLEHVRLWDSLSGQVQKELPNGTRGGVFSPDGKHLAFGRYPKEEQKESPVACLWNIAAEKELCRLEHPRLEGFYFKNLAFSADGHTLLVLAAHRDHADYHNRSSLHRWNLTTGKLLNTILRRDTVASWSALAADGRTAALAHKQGLLLIDVAQDEDLWMIKDEPAAAGWWRSDFSRDGGFLFAWTGEGHVGIWEIASRSAIARICLRREGNLLLAKWPEPEKDGKREPENPVMIQALAVSPDGRHVATAELFYERISLDTLVEGPLRLVRIWGPLPLIRIWETATGKEVQRLEGFRSAVVSLAFSPDGRRLASSFRNDTVLIWDTSHTVVAVGGKQQPLTAKQLNQLWVDLSSADGARGHAAMVALQEAPQQAVEFLAQHVRPVTEEEAKHVRRLLLRLDSKSFSERAASTRELKILASQYRYLLQKTLKTPGSLEYKRRLEGILQEAPRQLPSPTLRTVRAILTLQRIDTVEARRLLSFLAEGAADAIITRVAQTALAGCRIMPHDNP